MTITLAEFEALVLQMPRRYHAMLIDRMLECVPGKSARAMKGVTVNEPYFQGHFPDYPVMPGVLVLEALIQLSILLSHESGAGLPDTVLTLDAVRFKRQVMPGDQLLLETRMQGDGRYSVRALVGDEVAAEAQIALGNQPLPI